MQRESILCGTVTPTPFGTIEYMHVERNITGLGVMAKFPGFK